jgi:hypothetical protein
LLLLKGIDAPTIMETLGHAVIHTTMQYAHVAPPSLRRAAATMDDLLAAPGPPDGRSDGRSEDRGDEEETAR